jgi:hypothetical protein
MINIFIRGHTMQRQVSMPKGDNMNVRTAIYLTSLFLPALLLLPVYAQDNVTPSEALQFRNQFTTVCGKAVQGIYMPELDNKPTFIYLDKPYPDQIFEIVISGSTRGQFGRVPEVLYPGRNVCATGVVIDFLGVPQILVDQPGQISVQSDRK